MLCWSRRRLRTQPSKKYGRAAGRQPAGGPRRKPHRSGGRCANSCDGRTDALRRQRQPLRHQRRTAGDGERPAPALRRCAHESNGQPARPTGLLPSDPSMCSSRSGWKLGFCGRPASYNWCNPRSASGAIKAADLATPARLAVKRQTSAQLQSANNGAQPPTSAIRANAGAQRGRNSSGDEQDGTVSCRISRLDAHGGPQRRAAWRFQVATSPQLRPPTSRPATDGQRAPADHHLVGAEAQPTARRSPVHIKRSTLDLQALDLAMPAGQKHGRIR